MDLHGQLHGMKQHIPSGQRTCNLLPCLHPTLRLLFGEETEKLQGAFRLHCSKWTQGLVRRGSDFALDEMISPLSRGPFLLQGCWCCGSPVHFVSGILTSKWETSLSGISLPDVNA